MAFRLAAVLAAAWGLETRVTEHMDTLIWLVHARIKEANDGQPFLSKASRLIHHHVLPNCTIPG